MNSVFAFYLVSSLVLVSGLFMAWWLENRGWIANEKAARYVAMGLSSFFFMLMPVLVDGPIRNKYYERIDDVYFYLGPFVFFLVTVWVSVIVGRD